jgi:hypothetical protein
MAWGEQAGPRAPTRPCPDDRCELKVTAINQGGESPPPLTAARLDKAIHDRLSAYERATGNCAASLAE